MRARSRPSWSTCSDVAGVFRRAAAAGPASLRALVEEFGQRTDVTPQAFGFRVEDALEGPRCRSEAPPVEGGHPG
jgi:hypothetical protein